MRPILLILILAVVALILLIQSGFLSVTQTREAALPSVETNGTSVTTTGGQSPTFQVETGSIAVGEQPKNVQVTVPTIKVIPANEQAAAANQAE